MDKQEIDRLYTREYYLSHACEGYRPYLDGTTSLIKQKEAALLDLKNKDAVLDIGCGRGEFLRYCSNKITGTFSGIDYSSDAVALAQETLAARENCTVVVASSDKLPFADESFTKINMGDVLEHLTPEVIDRTIPELLRVLKPGGILLIHTAPNLYFLRLFFIIRFVMKCVGKGKLADELHHKIDNARDMHINVQSYLSLRKTAKKTGRRFNIWIDRDLLRSGSNKFTNDLNNSFVGNILNFLSRFFLVRLLIGNDLWCLIRK